MDITNYIGSCNYKSFIVITHTACFSPLNSSSSSCFSHCCLYFLWLFSAPDSTCTPLLTQSLPPLLCFSLLFFFFTLPFFLPVCSLHFSEIAKDLEEWGKLDHWRISVLLPGHMVFHSIWKFEFFYPMVVSMWEYRAFQPLNWGLRFITVTLSTYFCPVSYYSWRDEQARRTE